MSEFLKKNWKDNKNKILVKLGGYIISLLSIISTWINILLGTLDPTTALLLSAIIGLTIPFLQNVTGMVFGVNEEELKKELQDERNKNTLLIDELTHEMEVTEWKLKTVASNDEARQSVIENSKWNELNRYIGEIKNRNKAD